MTAQLETERLILRHWRDSDREPFAALNADARVMEHFPSVKSRAESDGQVTRFAKHFDDHGFGLWAVEVKDGAPFIGFVGLMVPHFDAPFMPCVEIGWRLAFDQWGKGYATEAARRAIDDGFTRLGLSELVSFTVEANVRSRAVMDRLGMTHDPSGDFDHPLIDKNDPTCRHVLYRLSAADWC
ncbi:MAG: GNAT family N-acetyltransferase [Pseudomonadota bacterium]